jgi:hypothetical protein
MEDRLWSLSLKSKKEPIFVRAAIVGSSGGFYVFKNAAGEEIGRYIREEVQGYSITPPPRVR